MKKIMLLLLLIPITLNAQFTMTCDTENDHGLHTIHSGNIVMDFENEPPIVINTFFHDDDIDTPVEITEAQFLGAIAYLNQTYNRFNIFFKYRGFDTNPEPIENMLNIFVTAEDGGFGGSPNFTQATYLAFLEGTNRQFVIAHEVGHVLGLEHTDRSSSQIVEQSFDTPLVCNEETIISGNFLNLNLNNIAENVTRDINNPNFNALTTGDFILDTPANYRVPNYCINTSTNPPTIAYLFSDEVVDKTGTPYVDVDVANIMGTDFREEILSFKTHFTDGQGIFMREEIAEMENLQAILTDVASLYEPYQGDYFFAGPNLPNHRPLFQPGFDYKFVSAGGQTPSGDYQAFNIPSDYENIDFIFNANDILNEVSRFSLDLNNIYHTNRSAIIIEQLESQPRRCYHNINRGASNGKIIKFNDNTFNHNYTVTEQDSIHINQSTLIQNLENGLYIIEKNYDDGTQEQKTILKGNNND